jgi:PAS domain S-box-containing protein
VTPGSSLRILLLEDDPGDAELIQELLEIEHCACEVTRVETRDEFLAALEQGGVDLILADYTLPSFDGLSALRLAISAYPEVPFIFVSGTLGEEVATEALKIGATDYILKTRLSRLVPSVHRALREAKERTERKRAEQELRQLVDFVPQLIVVFDSDGKVIHANRVAREYTGLTLQEFRSMDVFGMVIHPDDVEKAGAQRKHGFAGSEPFELDARLRGKDGIHRWFLGRYNPLVEEGRVRRWYVSATEIESRKQEEERVRKENVRLEERTRIAQELHDTLLQTFQSASLHLSAALYGIGQDSPVRPQFDRILQLMQQGVQEGRDAIQDLRTSESHTADLVLALSRIRQELDVEPVIDFQVIQAGQQKQFPPGIQHEIYRIGREALVNAFSHSGAKRVELELEYSDNKLHMRIRDDGRGMDPQVLEKGRDGHWGLAGMRERATRIGGLLKILSSATAGTEIQLSIPLERSFSHHSSE